MSPAKARRARDAARAPSRGSSGISASERDNVLLASRRRRRLRSEASRRRWESHHATIDQTNGGKARPSHTGTNDAGGRALLDALRAVNGNQRVSLLSGAHDLAL